MLHCDSRMKGHVQGWSKNSSWGTEAKALTKPRTSVCPDLNNQESCGAVDQVDPGRVGKQQYFLLQLSALIFLVYLFNKRAVSHRTQYFAQSLIYGKQRDNCYASKRKPNLIYLIKSRLPMRIMLNVLKQLVMLYNPLTLTFNAWGHLRFHFPNIISAMPGQLLTQESFWYNPRLRSGLNGISRAKTPSSIPF